MKKVVILFFSVLVLWSCNTDIKFDQKYWKENSDKRYRMSKNIVETKMLIGKSKDEIRGMLTDECKHCDKESNDWMYYTKVEKGWLDAEIEILDIKFKDEKVIEVSIRK